MTERFGRNGQSWSVCSQRAGERANDCSCGTCVATERVQSLASLAVGGVDVTVSGSGADQDGSATLWTLHEGKVSDGAVMHAKLQVRACQL